jgi:hypothetical protein
VWSTLPVTANVSEVPGVRVPGASTGDCAGALSPEQHNVPFGMPARKGLALPGTIVCAKTGTLSRRAVARIRPTRLGVVDRISFLLENDESWDRNGTAGSCEKYPALRASESTL